MDDARLDGDSSAWLEMTLEQLLSEPRARMIERAQTTFDRLAAPNNESIVLFGAGPLGRQALDGLRRAGIRPLAFVDNNPALWDRLVDGLPVRPPIDAVQQFGQSAAFVVTIYNGSVVRRQLSSMGLEIC
jgi:FlaA1/EpsC-like NDP-sugar epimerase